jgi:hypothetical protein
MSYGSQGNVGYDEMWGVVCKFFIIEPVTYFHMTKF